MCLKSEVKITAIYFLFTFLNFCNLSYAEQPCTNDITVNSDAGSTVENAEIIAIEKPQGTKISIVPKGLVQRIALELPSELYRKIEVSAQKNLDNGKGQIGDIAFLTVWPCNDTHQSTITMSQRSGSAEEVRIMWENKELANPPDSATAALYYAQALATAEARQRLNPNSARQWDLISTYLALRAFIVYAKLSEVPLAQSERLQKIAIRHVLLFGKVNKKGLSVITKEGAGIASERNALAIFYNKLWNKINSLEENSTTLENLIRFRKSIDREADSDQLLRDIGLSRSELIASINTYAGRLVSNNSRLEPSELDLVDEQIQATKKLLKAGSTSNKIKLSRDIDYLSKRFDRLKKNSGIRF